MLRLAGGRWSGMMRCFSGELKSVLSEMREGGSLEEMNRGAAKVVQISLQSLIDRRILTSPDCSSLVYSVMCRIPEMTSSQLVTFCNWHSQASKNKLGWRNLTAEEDEKLTEKIKEYDMPKRLSFQELTQLFESLTELKHPSNRFIGSILDSKLQDQSYPFSITEALILLEACSHMHIQNRKVTSSLIKRIMGLRINSLESNQAIQLYKGLSNLEVNYHSRNLMGFLDKVAEYLAKRSIGFPETDYMQLLEIHFSLHYPRLWLSHNLLHSLPERLAVSSKSLGTFSMRILESIKASQEFDLSHLAVKRILDATSKIVAEGTPSEAEAVLKSAVFLGGEFPLSIIDAAKHRLKTTKEHTLAIACSRLIEATGEDFPSIGPHITAVISSLSNLSIDEQLSLLSLIYTKRGIGPFGELEKAILASFHNILEKDAKEAIALAKKVMKHHNELIRDKLHFVKKETLELLAKEWPSDISVHSLLRTCLELGTDNPTELTNVLLAQKGKILPEDLEHTMSQVKDPDLLESSVLVTFEALSPNFSPEGLIILQRIFERNSSRKNVERFLKLVNQVDLNKVKMRVLLGALGNIRKLIDKFELNEAVSDFAANLIAFRSSPNFLKLSLNDMDVYSDGFMHSLGLISSEQLVDTLQKHIGNPELRNPILGLVSSVWPDIKKRGFHQTVLNVTYDFMRDIQIKSLKVRIETFAELPESIPFGTFIEAIRTRMLVIPPHLYSKAVSCLSRLPIRFLSKNGEFIRRLIADIQSLHVSPEHYLKSYQAIKLIRTLATQRISVQSIPEMVKGITHNIAYQRPIDTVRLLEGLCLAEKRFEDAISTLCYNISQEPGRFLEFTGPILGALSDGNLQFDLLSAKVAESLVFSPKQTFEFTPSEAAQVLMFCVRIGMDDNTLIKKLLAISPKKNVGRFSLKRYLMKIYFQEKKTELFSHPLELPQFQSYLETNGWKYIQDADPHVAKSPEHNFVRNLYLPRYDEEIKMRQWRVSSMGVALFTQDKLLGDYLFYQDLCRKVGECDLKLTFPSL